MLMTSGLNHGVRNSLPHALGISIGFPLMMLVVGLGIGALFLAYPAIHIVIKVCSIVYLLYLAWKIANASNPDASEELRKPLTFIQAASFQWLNPKAWVMVIGAIAIFTTPENIQIQMLRILLSFLTIGTLCMFFWLFFGVLLQKVLRSKKQLQCFNIAMAALLVLSVIPMAMTELGGTLIK